MTRAATVPPSAEFPPPVISLAVSEDFEHYTVYIYNGAKFGLCLPWGNYDPFSLSLTYDDGRVEKNEVTRNWHPSWEQRQNWVQCPDAVLAGESIEREFPLTFAFSKIDRRPFVICTTFYSALGNRLAPGFTSKACSHVRPLANGKLKITPRLTQTRLRSGFW